MTSIEWLEDNIHSDFTYNQIMDLLEKAKEMHKQEIINTWYNGYINQSPMIDEENCGEKFYQETFVSKGSETLKDYHIVDTNEMIYPKTAFEILQPKLTIADTLEFREKHLPEILDAMEEYATSSQTEISDEEIEKEARDYDNSVIYGPPLLHFEQGAFWYREQLKQRQCNK